MKFLQRELTDYLQNNHEVIRQLLDNQHSIENPTEKRNLYENQWSWSHQDENQNSLLTLSTFDIYAQKPPSQDALEAVIKNSQVKRKQYASIMYEIFCSNTFSSIHDSEFKFRKHIFKHSHWSTQHGLSIV